MTPTLIREGIITSILLIILGVGGYILGMQADKASFTALIPAIIGALILTGSLIATKNLKMGMHIAALFGLLGAIAPLGRLIPTIAKGTFTWGLPSISQIATVVICTIFTILCVQSFIRVRRERKNA